MWGGKRTAAAIILFLLCLTCLHLKNPSNQKQHYFGTRSNFTDVTKTSYESEQHVVNKVLTFEGNNPEVTVDVDRGKDKVESLFVPGSLNLTRLETFQRCYVDDYRYRKHFGKRKRKCEISETQKLVYVQISKAGSSSARTNMKRLFGDVEYKACNPNRTENDNFHHFTFARDPLSRFLSSFREAMKRWNNADNFPEKFDFLQKFRAEFSKRERRDYINNDHDKMIELLEDFVREFDGQEVPDGHLRLQVPNIVPDRQVPHLDAIYDVENLTEEFIRLSVVTTAYNNKNDYNDNVASRKHANEGMHFNITLISLWTQRKMCQLLALDFCCLNYWLPPECKSVVSCRWIRHPEQQAQSSSVSLAIEAVSPYPPQLLV